MSASVIRDDYTLSLTERHLFSLFAQYPEISFDPESKHALVARPKVQSDEISSSPTSTLVDEGDRSYASNSTPHTTPLRQLHLVQAQRTSDTDTVTGYLRRLRQTDLPEECRLCFTSLVQSIGAISAGMTLSTNGRYRLNNTYFMDQCSVLLREVQILASRTKEQINQIAHLKTLFMFEILPTDDTLWAIYRQRSLLIIKCTALPCTSELDLIHRLAHLYNTVIYGPIQQLIDENELEDPTLRMLNALYDAMFTWLAYYRQWTTSMKDLKQQYMTPLVDRILASQPAWSDVKTMRRAKRNAEIAICNPVGPSMLPLDERVLTALNLSARRKEAFAKMGKLKTVNRFRREKTL